MTITFPHTFHDGVKEVASGKQVMENLKVLSEALEALEAAQLVAGSAYTEGPAWALDTEYEPNAAHPSLVIVRWGLYVAAASKQANLRFLVGGVEVDRNAIETAEGGPAVLQAESCTFIVAAKAKWYAHQTGGPSAPEAKRSVYLQL